MKRYQGFSLIELLIVTVIIGILASVAIPAYTEYVQRGKIIEATTTLLNLRVRMEQYYQDNRTYLTPTGGCGVPMPQTGTAVQYFTFTCPAPTVTTYTISATGVAAVGMDAFTYTINQSNAKSSTITASGWTGNTGCWVTKKNGTC